MKRKGSDPRKTVLSGRLGRFARILAEHVDDVGCEQVLAGADAYASLKDPGKAAWWRSAMGRLEELAGPEKAGKIMEKCGRKCCGAISRKHARRVWESSENLSEFLEELNRMGLGGGRLRIEENDEDVIVTGGYDRCYCGQVRQTEEPFPTMTYCQCSAGWYKQLFESATGRPVMVTVDRSIITGSSTCEFTIVLQD